MHIFHKWKYNDVNHSDRTCLKCPKHQEQILDMWGGMIWFTD